VQGDMASRAFQPTSKRVHATSNANIVNHIKYKRVLIENGIESINGKLITFAGGRSEEFDTLIAATGYAIDLEFLDKRIVEERDNSLDLYMRIVPPDWRGLYFLAYFNSDTALNWICEGQVRWLREHELGRAKLPSVAEMRTEIHERKEWVRKHFKDTPRHGIEAEHLPYFSDLRRTMKEAQRRAGAEPRDVGIAAVNTLPLREAMAS